MYIARLLKTNFFINIPLSSNKTTNQITLLLPQVKIWEDGKCLGTIETMEEVWDLLAIQDHLITVRHIDVTMYSISQRGKSYNKDG